MKYLPKIDVWAPGITEALRSGALRLQPGQWIECGTGSRKYGHYPSRFSHVTRGGGIIVAYHGPDAAKQFLAVKAGEKAAQAFLDACRSARLAAPVLAAACAEEVKRQVISSRLAKEA
jgi:hypothetical protein